MTTCAAGRAADDFTHLAAQAAREVQGPEPGEEEIAEAVKRAREASYRER